MCSQAKLRSRKIKNEKQENNGQRQKYNNKNTDRFCIAFASERQCIHAHSHTSPTSLASLDKIEHDCGVRTVLAVHQFIAQFVNLCRKIGIEIGQRTRQSGPTEKSIATSHMFRRAYPTGRCACATVHFSCPFSLSFNGSVYSWKVIHLW